jgi:chromosome segregation ATPase
LRTKRTTPRRQRSSSDIQLVQMEIELVRDDIAKLERESAAHMRRCAEMQAEIDVLKATLAIASSPRPILLTPTKAPTF